jgi:hypothetical protein
MRTFPNDDLRQMLSDPDPRCRRLALEFLSEGYAENSEIMAQVFSVWDHWGVAQAFPEFALLSHLAVAESQIGECCERATKMAQQRKLTDPVARCAGKLLEQVTCAKASALQPHVEQIQEVSTTSKIFFRVDNSAVRDRVALLQISADDLASQLDEAIARLSRESSATAAFLQGLHALEALRFQHPTYIDMASAVSQSPPSDGPRAISFQLSMHSLIQYEHVGTEAQLAQHLLDPREPVYTNAVEALVRVGTPLAAAYLLAQFEPAQPTAQRWIARGLQRIRAEGLAVEIANLRERIEDPALWLMLLVAEARQFDPASIPRLTHDVQHVGVYAGALLDALNVYVRLLPEADEVRGLQQAYLSYLQDANRQAQSKLSSSSDNVER